MGFARIGRRAYRLYRLSQAATLPGSRRRRPGAATRAKKEIAYALVRKTFASSCRMVDYDRWKKSIRDVQLCHEACVMHDEGRKRVVIDYVGPQIDCGRFPIKRAAGETVTVAAHAFADGHDQIREELLHKRIEQSEWTSGK